MEAPMLIQQPEEKTPAQMRSLIMQLEAAMMAMPEHHVEIKTTHHFAPGVYMREIFIPKGTTLTGKIHRTEHMNILSQGDLSVWTEDGVKRLKASTVIKSQPGIKRVGFAHEDSVWITVHPTEETDIDKLEDMLIAKSFDEVLGFAEPKQIVKEDK
jgi:quercetin dioxygenase-like cupin family protein